MLDARHAVPTGTVTFMFTDIEGSTKRWDAHREAMQIAVRKHDEIMRAVIGRCNGSVFKTIGDAFCAAFSSAADAVEAAVTAQRAVGDHDWISVGGLRVRMALHSGVTEERDDDYFGPVVNRVARLLAVAHGGQVLLSGAAKALLADSLPKDMALRDLGTHRLKDLSTPEQVFQLDSPGTIADFPSLRSLDVVPNNLPYQLSPLVGRDAEVAGIQKMLQASRMVTLVGSGGIGKTRVALQVAADVARDDGAWFIDLAPCADPSLVPSIIATVLNVADEGGSQSITDRIAKELKGKKLLLVLDNCEHVVEAAAEVASHLLRTCADVRILATSREALRIGGEEVYRMPALAVPPEGVRVNANTALDYGAVALFVSRARAAKQTFEVTDANAETIAEIVRRLDGIALAIELAAPRVKVLTLAQLSQRLDDRLKLLTGGSRTALPRQQTLRALIAWSYDLLDGAQRNLFDRLAIFRGSFTLDAVERVIDDGECGDILDSVASLVDKSLVVAEAGPDEEVQRYRLLASTHEFALESLTASGTYDDVAARHSEYFADLARTVGAGYWQTETDAWLASARTDLDNYRAAISWALEGSSRTVTAADIFGALRGLWCAVARQEGAVLASRIQAALPSTAPAQSRGIAALADALIATAQGMQGTDAAALAVQLLAPSDPAVYAEALNTQVQALANAGQLNAAIDTASRAITAARGARLPRLLGEVLGNAGYWLSCEGDRAGARAFLDEAAPLLRACGDRAALARLEMIRAELSFADGDAPGALAGVLESQVIYRQRKNEFWLCIALLNAAAYQVELGLYDDARRSAREAADIAGRRNDDFWLALAIGHLARLAAEVGEVQRAARLIAFVDGAYARLGNVREPTEQKSYDRLVQLLKASLPESTIATLMSEGASMTPQAAAAEAMTIANPAASV